MFCLPYVRVSSCCVIATLILAGSCFAQPPASGSTSPYAGLQRTKPVWPPFYKPDPSDAKYAALMARGSCNVTGNRAKVYYVSKMMDVNVLPDASFQGTITKIQNGLITATDDTQTKSVYLMVHDSPSISSVLVHGPAAAEVLQTGGFVRFVGKVDGEGHVVKPVQSLEITAPEKSEPIVDGREQVLTGKIVRTEPHKLTVLSTSQRIRRLSIDLASDLKVEVALHDVRLASVGDSVTVEGRMYRPSADAPAFFFAEQLDVTLAAPLKPKPAK